ncbi:DUF2878 domain-containing protein [uncultured Porticoccus sp.]|uniref:DUF2878 domain-containing protein n=1 Tax=uncultured Porticoccus sp. TaxID=1256050 RepID=UPI0030DC13B7
MFSGISECFWVNLAGFQFIWWLSVLLGNSAAPVVLLLLALHIAFHSQPVGEIHVLLVCAILGFTVDALLTLGGVFVFSQDNPWPPVWLVLLWLGFAATLRQCLRFFSRRYLLSAAAGSVAGALTYWAAVNLGAADFGFAVVPSLMLLAVVWMALFPALMLLADRLGGDRVQGW